jgi:hypothetical protein
MTHLLQKITAALEAAKFTIEPDADEHEHLAYATGRNTALDTAIRIVTEHLSGGEVSGEAIKAAYLEGCSAGRWPNPDDEEAYLDHWGRSDARAALSGNRMAAPETAATLREAMRSAIRATGRTDWNGASLLNVDRATDAALSVIQPEIDRLRAGLAEARQALGFYATAWVDGCVGSGNGQPGKRLLADKGNRARQALAEASTPANPPKPEGA